MRWEPDFDANAGLLKAARAFKFRKTPIESTKR
jgi:hypothetical protein